MKLKNKKNYTLNPVETYETVMRLRRANKRWGPKTFKKYLDDKGVEYSMGALRGWIYANKQPFLTKIITQIPGSSKELTKEKAYILGTLCGDGWISTGYRIGLNVIDKDFADYFKRCLENVYKIKCSNTSRVREPNGFCSTPARQYTIMLVSKLAFKDLQRYHHSFKTKEWRVPKQVLNASKEIQASFIKGFADSESSVKNRHRNREIMLCSGNYGGIKDLQQILIKTFGMKSHYSIRKSGVHILTTSDYKSLKIFYDEIGFIIKRKMDQLEQGLKRYKRKGIRKYSKEFKQLAMELMNQGLTYYQVGKLIGTSPANVYGWWKSKKF